MTTTLADIPVQRGKCRAIREEHRRWRQAPPRIRVWANRPDSGPGLILRGEVADHMAGRFRKTKNIAAPGMLRIRLDHYIARWLISIPNDPNAKKNVVLTVDWMGGWQWSGILKTWRLRTIDGVEYLEVTWIHDLQFLQFMLGPPNPVLPIPIFQFPRVWPIFGPAKWAISMLILLQLIRLNGNLYTLPDDPFNLDSWDDLINWDDWQVLIKANPFDLDDSSTWTLLATRMTRIDTAIEDALDDAKLVLTCRRIITVDGEECPIEGINCANGALVLEVVDPAQYWSADGTATSGGIAAGFVRTAQQFLEGFVEDTSVMINDDQSIHPGEYFQPGFYGTVGTRPWIVLRDSPWTQIKTSDLVWSPATAVSVIVGGDNPLADQLARLTIESVAALIGYFLLGGFSGLGAIAADIVMPFLVGTIFAWLQWENHSRGHQLGWVHLYEILQQGAENNAWSLAGIAALRAGFLATDSETAHQLTFGAGCPIMPGLHYDIGTPIGSTKASIGDMIFVDQVEDMVLEWDWDQGKGYEWITTVGTAKALMSQSERSARLLNKSLQTLANLGVHLIS
ncbi:hypothetical protein [Nocardia cyriacigeorgica]|uniref:Gp37-like protein n=1 Tax=Nocardia cyriacigeorgica TaxID=135487 RepID=UPI0024541AC0|nr:hypothetical protein [Nocardia cyriacigeorgica]